MSLIHQETNEQKIQREKDSLLSKKQFQSLLSLHPELEKLTNFSAFRRFDMNKAQTAINNMEIAAITASQTYPEPMCIVNGGDWISEPDYKLKLDMGIAPIILKCPVYCKPVACLLDFISNREVPGESTYELTKKKGSSVTQTMSVEAKASASGGIFGCEVSLSVTTGYSYSSTIDEETTEKWTEKLTEGSYYVFQNYLVYAYRFEIEDSIMVQYKSLFEQSNGITIYKGKNNRYYTFLPVYRNDPFTKRYKEDFWSTISRNDLYNFLMGDGLDKWI